MQRADGKGRVRMPVVRPRLFMPCVIMVDVEMHMSLTVMFVFMRVDIVFERPAQRPKANTEEDHANNPIAPRRQQIHRQPVPQPQR